MRFILDPEAKNHSLKRANLDSILSCIEFSKLDPTRLERAVQFLKTNRDTTEIYAPFIPILHPKYSMRFEGKHRLHALQKLGYHEVAIGVPKTMDLTKLGFLL